VLTRQALRILDRTRYIPAEIVLSGAYILRDVDQAEVILTGTGSEVHLALTAQEISAAENGKARVVSLPCWELFDEQPDEYREDVLPPTLRPGGSGGKCYAGVGALRRTGWRNRRTGSFWRFVALPGLYQKLGITAEAVAEAAHPAKP
jgi:transketolase